MQQLKVQHWWHSIVAATGHIIIVTVGVLSNRVLQHQMNLSKRKGLQLLVPLMRATNERQQRSPMDFSPLLF